MLTERKLINRDPEILSGMPVFMGTRVPVQNLFDYLEGDHSLSEFLEAFRRLAESTLSGFLKWRKKRC